MKKTSFIKDALILCLITLISGLSLGYIYGITKEPIAKAKIAAKISAYKKVFVGADEFKADHDFLKLISETNEELKSGEFKNVMVDEVAMALDSGANTLGYVIEASSFDGYGGKISLSIGLNLDKSINGIAFLELNETPGLGMKASEEEFSKQFVSKNSILKVTKSGQAKDDEINAISGATITSEAVTNAVNAATYILENKLLK